MLNRLRWLRCAFKLAAKITERVWGLARKGQRQVDQVVVTAQKTSRYFSSLRADIEVILPDYLGATLEIGCASGKTMKWIRAVRPVSYARGVELVPEVAAEAMAAFDDVVIGNIESDLIASDVEFDTVIALDVLEHLRDPWSVVSMLAGHLKPGGCFLASIPNVSHWHVLFPLLFKGEWNYEAEGILDRTHLRFFSEVTARSLFNENGFIVEKLSYVTNYPSAFSLFTKNSRWQWYGRRLMATIMPPRFGHYQFLIRARKLK